MAVGHDHFRTFGCAQHRGSQTDLLEQPNLFVDLDHIAHFDRTLKQQDQSGYKVVDDVLQTKTDAEIYDKVYAEILDDKEAIDIIKKL